VSLNADVVLQMLRYPDGKGHVSFSPDPQAKKDLLGRTGHIRKNISRRCRVPPGETLTGCSASHAVAITEYPVMPLRSGGFAIIFSFL